MKKIVIDVDAGIDDCMALLFLINSEKLGQVKIKAIICSMGNTTVENVCKNVLRFLEITGRTDIPVYKGASKPIIPLEKSTKKYFGEDGFGDLIHAKNHDLSAVSKIPAAVALHDIVSSNPNDISIICLGPLTNLALSLRLYSDMVHKIKDVWIMGGNHDLKNNSMPEFNFSVDPEAAHIVIESLRCPIFMLPWETCLKPEIPLNWRDENLDNEHPALKLLIDAENNIIPPEEKHWMPCDCFLTFCFIDPKNHIIRECSNPVSIELKESSSRGLVLLKQFDSDKDNVTIIKVFDHELFKQTILKITSKIK